MVRAVRCVRAGQTRYRGPAKYILLKDTLERCVKGNINSPEETDTLEGSPFHLTTLRANL
jgi:hypothetical protein